MVSPAIHCPHFIAQRCVSCRWLALDYATQLAQKTAHLTQQIRPFGVQHYAPPVTSPLQALRYKAKMVVLGAAHQPILGIISPDGTPTSLVDCPLYPPAMQMLLGYLVTWIQKAGIPPYRIDKAKGELKYILLTQSRATGEFLLRLVLRSEQALPRIQAHLASLLQAFPAIRVVSVNLQPIHQAILEGEQEIVLTPQTHITEWFNQIPLRIQPKSFFQTNPVVAAQLYQTARDWIQARQPDTLWDLFCGVGGFGLHCATPDTHLTGIEIEPAAIASAQHSAQQLGLKHVRFQALASDTFAEQAHNTPDVVIVNPPRRGLGATLAQQLNHFAPATLLYSSCNATTLAQDLTHLTRYQIERVQLFDMFPHTAHYEVLMLLRRRD